MRTYVGVIVVIGFATIVQSLVDIVMDPKGWAWTVLAILHPRQRFRDGSTSLVTCHDFRLRNIRIHVGTSVRPRRGNIDRGARCVHHLVLGNTKKNVSTLQDRF